MQNNLQAHHFDNVPAFLENKKFHEDKKKEVASKKRHHKISHDDGLKQSKLFKSGETMGVEITPRLGGGSFQKKWDLALVQFAAKEKASFKMLGGPAFRELIGSLTNHPFTRFPKFKLKTGVTISRQVQREAKEVRDNIVRIIWSVKEELNSIAYTTDIWTSRNGDPFMSLTIHFLTEKLTN